MNEYQHLRITKIENDYYKQREPEPQHFADWTNSLEKPMSTLFGEKGFEACKGVVSFRRFAAGANDQGLKKYLRMHLTEEDYKAWRQAK